MLQIPFFKEASQKNIEKYFSDNNLRRKDFGNGETIYSPNDASACIGVIVEGNAKIYPNCGDEKTLLKSISSGDIFGISNLYTDAVFPSIVIADKHASVLFMDGNAFRAFIENDSSALKEYLQFLSKKIIYLNQKIATLSAGSAEAKLALYLFEHSNGGILQLSCSMSELATTLGVGRASLYRSLDKLIDEDIIKRNGSELRIIDTSKLSCVASKYIPPVIN